MVYGIVGGFTMPYKNIEQQKEAQREHYLRNKDKFNTRRRIRRRSNQEYVLNIKKQSSCTQCGNNDYRCLEFHHLDDKELNIAQAVSQHSTKKLLQELNKCIILCANCHRILHYDETHRKRY